MFRLYTIFFDFVAVIYSDYPTTASYDELVAQIRNAGGVVNSEINTDKLDGILNSDEITNIDRDEYTDESLKGLDEAIVNAKEALNNPNSSLEDIKNAADGVLEAIGNLEEKAPADSDVPTAIKYLYIKISEKSEIFI